MTVTVTPVSFQVPFYLDNVGAALAGGSIQTFVAGSTTPLATYTDLTGNTQNSTTIPLGNDGSPTTGGIFLDITKNYKFVWFDAAGTQVRSRDNIQGNPYFVTSESNILFATDSGSANSYQLTTTVPLTALATGQLIYFVPTHDNTGASTINVNGIGVNTLLDSSGNALSGGEMGGPLIIAWNGTDWTLLFTLPLVNKQTPAEVIAGVMPVNYAYPPGNAFRYGVDPTGTNDSTTAIQNWIDATWAMYQYTDAQGLWDGQGGAMPIMQLPPGKFKVSGTMYLPSGCTFKGTGHPAHTVSHTRIIMNSTGVIPPNSWTSSATWDLGDIIQVGNGFWYFCTVGGAGGSTAPAFPTTVGATVSDGAATWQNFGTVGAAGSDNRNIPMFKFRRGTLPGVGPGTGPGQGGSLQNGGFCSAIQELEFWFVTLGSNFQNPLGPGGACNQRSYPNGATFAFDVDATDTRIIDCVFQNSPASLWMKNVSQTSATRGDGFTGNRGINIFVENCEFDASSAHIWASGCYLQNLFKSCQFFNSPQYIYNCTGKQVYQACYFQDGEMLDYGVGISTGGASPAANSMTSLSILGCDVESPENYYFLQTNGVNLVNVTDNSFFTPAVWGGVSIRHAVGGMVSNNAFDSQGANVPAGSAFSNYHACVKLDGCTNMQVRGNTITSTFSATYAGFGILVGTSDSTTSTGNIVDGNSLTAAYGGATYNGNVRGINVSAGNYILLNYLPNNWVIPKMSAVANWRIAPTYGTTVTFDASTGTIFEIGVTNTTAFTLANPTNPTEGQIIYVEFINNSGGSLGTVTFGTAFKTSNSNPAPTNGGNITIMFKFDGTHWYEMFRSQASTSN